MNSNKRKRLDAHERSEQILIAAINLSKKIGYRSITRDKVANRIGISSSLVARYYPRMCDLEYAIMKAAIEREIVEIIAQVITVDDCYSRKVPAKLKVKALNYLTAK